MPLGKDDDDDDDDEMFAVPAPPHAVPAPADPKQNAIDITANDLIERLTPQNVADLVLLSMVRRERFIKLMIEGHCLVVLIA